MNSISNIALIDKLNIEKTLTKEEWVQLIRSYTEEDAAYAAAAARKIADRRFGNKVFFRGIIEYSNICKNNCYYCGIRCGNANLERYRLDKDTILECCYQGYQSGYRTFVLQGGEDPFFTTDKMVDIVSSIRSRYPDCAITLSIGELEREDYQRLYDAGANRFLLRHETANSCHYSRLHPENMTLAKRIQCLKDLKEIGFQTGCGMMVGSPFQTAEHLAEDMMFIADFKPHMIGVGPFIPHHDTPFRDEKPGSVALTLFLLSLCRILLPDVLLPATTALGTLSTDGRKAGVLAGANVIMPNLSPVAQREKYMLYDNKAITGDDAGESLKALQASMAEIGFELEIGRGDYKEGSDRND
ncbi:MAG: [Oscillospiraceae bacterium]|nr:[FeFe] hydrogenase H-cluster radical SAM maturase HydE [Oscillospiraceae bacterium]